MLRHQVGGVNSATDLLDPELLVLFFLMQPEVFRLHVFHGAAPAAESQSACCCSICPDSYVSIVSQLSWSVGQPGGFTRTAYHAKVLRLRAAQWHRLLCRRPTRKHPPDVERLVFVQLAASTSESPSIVTMLCSFCSGNTARGEWSKNRPIRFGRVRSARVPFPTSRVGLLPDMPVSLTRCGTLSPRRAPVSRGQVVYSAWRHPGSSVDAPFVVQPLQLPALRVVGQLPTSVQSRCV